LLPPLAGTETFLNAGAWLQVPGALRVVLDILMIGLFGGFYIVPLYASVQQRSDPSHRSRVIAANNVLNAFFMVLAAGTAIVVLGSGFSIAQLFLLVAICNGIVAAYIYLQAPEFILRFFSWVLIHTFYRIRVQGSQHIPATGSVILVCNHVSYVDALVIGGCIRRPVRFVMHYKYFEIPVLSWLFRAAGAIPIASTSEKPELLAAAFEQIDKLLARGEVVCIFPEGHLSYTGAIDEFRPGVEKILARRPVPVVPMALTGLWGSFFTREGKGLMRRFPKPLWYRVQLRIGAVIDGGSHKAADMRAAVLALTTRSSEAE
jgi:1-acyl-sn-glycerol-3-phosphate acyltransferase